MQATIPQIPNAIEPLEECNTHDFTITEKIQYCWLLGFVCEPGPASRLSISLAQLNEQHPRWTQTRGGIQFHSQKNCTVNELTKEERTTLHPFHCYAIFSKVDNVPFGTCTALFVPPPAADRLGGNSNPVGKVFYTIWKRF